MKTGLGKIVVIWCYENHRIQIIKIILPPLSINSIKRNYSGIRLKRNKAVDGILNNIKSHINGKKVKFNLKNLDPNRLSKFQKKVLMRTRMIPLGKTKSYGTIAKELGIPKGGAQAVGQALAKNPFPIIIPCHRVIKSDGTLGGFGGNISLKQKLLAIEKKMRKK
ncbi:MAG: methylated-DNA--[protein]-cysteine S-methyltransferase [bacterium]